MSPEQAKGDRRVLDDRTDVYSLGATLYELATLSPVVDGTNRADLIQKITSEFTPPAPRILNPTIPAELETILLKAISKDLEDRYSSAREVADDLGRFLNHEPIIARRPSFFVRASKWARRHTLLFVGMTFVLFSILVATFVAYSVTNQERKKTAIALQQAEENFEFALDAVDDMYLELATSWIADSPSPSLVQRDFLQRARNFYAKVADQPITSTKVQAQVARVHGRIGRIEYYLQNYQKAKASFQTSIEMGESLLLSQPENVSLRREIIRAHRMHAQTLRQMAATQNAAVSFDKAASHLAELERDDVLTIDDRIEQIAVQNGLAAIHLLTDNIDQAETAIQLAHQLIQQSPKGSPWPDLLRVTQLESRNLLARLHLARKRYSSAREEAQSILDDYRIRRDWFVRETRTAHAVEKYTLDLLGEISEAEGDFQQAAVEYKESLTAQLSSLESQKEPSHFFVTTRLLGEKGVYEPVPFCDYIETQQRLARVLLKLGRHYEAEYRLGQCMLAIHAIAADRPTVLRFQVAEANTWAPCISGNCAATSE